MSDDLPVPLLSTYTIYYHPGATADEKYTVMQFQIRRGQEPAVGEFLGVAPTLDSARALVPMTADACLTRSPEDDPTIVETWI